jgi:hypothetical protein
MINIIKIVKLFLQSNSAVVGKNGSIRHKGTFFIKIFLAFGMKNTLLFTVK